MDKSRLKKRQLKQELARNGGGGGDKVATSNCLGKLNSSNQDREMSGESQDEEEELGRLSSRSKASSKKFKLHSKSFIDRNAVDHANVPRKLRSAMNKRSRESLSPPLSYIKKAPHNSTGMEVPHTNGAKKSKQNLKQEDKISSTITKDEEEAVQTLFSMATMLPSEKRVEGRVDVQTSDEKSSSLQFTGGSPQLVSPALKEESTLSQVTSSAAKHTNLTSNLEESSKQDSLGGLTIMGQPIGYGNNKFDPVLGGSSALVDLLKSSMPSRGANADVIPLADPSELAVSPELCHVTRSVLPTNHEVSLCKQKVDYGNWPVLKATGKEELQQPFPRQNGSVAHLACTEGAPYLWPGMSRVQSCGVEGRGPSTWYSTTKIPTWLDSTTSSARTGSTETSVLTGKVKPVIVDRRQSWKRCTTHVCISRLIQAYQTAERKPCWPLSPGELKINGTTILGVTSTQNLLSSRTGRNGVISVDGTNVANAFISKANTNFPDLQKSPDELQSCNLEEKRVQQDQQMSILPSRNFSSENKNCDFLSLSAGGRGGGLEPVASTTSDSYRGGVGSISAQGQVGYLHPVQHHPLMSLSCSGVRSATSQSQLPQYASSPFYFPVHSGHGGLTKQQLEQQHQVWAAQLAYQYSHRSGGISGTNFPMWQNGMHESPAPTPPSSSSSPLELHSAKTSQQQQLFALTSLPSSSIGSKEHHPLHRTYVEGGGGLQADTSHPLQLVCSTEHMQVGGIRS